MKLATALLLILTGCGREKPNPSALFREIAGETGLRFTHFSGASQEFYMPEIMGSGGALFDFDDDGDLDVFLVQGAPLTGAPVPGLGNRLFRNELVPSRTLRFTDVTTAAGLGDMAYGMGAATGDIDGDGFTDLFVTNFGRNTLYRNNGNGTFAKVAAPFASAELRWSTSAAFVDYDRDGDLDLFVANYVDFTLAKHKRCFAASGEPDYCTPKAYSPVNASLYRNDGGGKFADVSVAAGITAARGPGLGVTITDANDDGWPDLYVANDTAANLLWMNQRNGTFREEGLAAGAAYAEDGLAKAGMGVSAGDYDGDGDDDLVVTNLAREGATLFRRDGPLLYVDASLTTSLRPATFAMTGFGVDWFDYDHDGFLDLFIANGAVTVMEELRGRPFPFQQKNALLHNEGGRRFTDVSGAAGPALQAAEVSRGAMFGDMDNDGDIDIVVTNNSGPVRLLRNEVGSARPWVMMKLAPARDSALHARVGLLRKGAPSLWRRAHSDSSYLCASDSRVHFGLGDSTPEGIEVLWPSGRRERFPAPAPRTLVTLREGFGRTITQN